MGPDAELARCTMDDGWHQDGTATEPAADSSERERERGRFSSRQAPVPTQWEVGASRLGVVVGNVAEVSIARHCAGGFGCGFAAGGRTMKMEMCG